MKITKNQTNYLLKNDKGEYHLSIEEFEKLGKEKAIELASKEIDKKVNSTYQTKTINFEQARELGFCEYGIKDFCERLNLDINKDYKLEDLNKALTMEVIQEYPDECIKLFGKDCIKYLGTPKELINEDNISLFLREEFISKRNLHKLAVKFAYSTLHHFENEYPDDKRPRIAIETKKRWIEEKIKLGEL